MTERVSYEIARVLLLRMIQDWLDRDEKPNPNPDALEIHGNDLRRFGEEELNWKAVDVFKLFKSLVNEWFIRPFPSKSKYLLELDGSIQYAWVEDLTEKGRQVKGMPVNFDEAYELGGEIFSVVREGRNLFDVRGVMDRRDRLVTLPPDATEVQAGDWLTSRHSGQEFRVTEVDVPPQFRGMAIIKAHYETKLDYEDRISGHPAGGTNISGGNFYGSNLNWGEQRDVEVAGSFDFRSIELEIDRRGGEDAEELKAALDEVRNLIESGQPLKEGVLAKFSKSIRDNAWFSTHVGKQIVDWMAQNSPQPLS